MEYPLITEAHIEEAKHCIGLDRKEIYTRHGKKFYKPYRNYYAAYFEEKIWSDLEDCGYAYHDTLSEINGKMLCCYYLNRRGLDWLEKQLNITIYDNE